MSSLLKLATVLLAAISAVEAVPAHPVHNLIARATENANLHKRSANCSNPYVRKEWRTLTSAERKAYTAAVTCLQSKKALSSSTEVPGAKSRFDDFTAVHINQTGIIHYTGTFLSWHRTFTWLYETALREECGYTGYQPYWEWSLDAENMDASPLFSGADDSMGSNGAYVAGRSDANLGGNGLPDLFIPPGSGGGCVTSGPFTNMSVNLGPVANTIYNISSTDYFRYNPRCLKRDLNTYVTSHWNNWTDVNTLLAQTTIGDFQYVMQGVPGSGQIGVHGGGHFSFGADPGGDLYTSPGDPVFYLHHAQIDRMWWIWQNLDFSARQNLLNGTGTMLDSPASPDTTLETVIDWGVLHDGMAVGDLTSTLSGPFCYTYA